MYWNMLLRTVAAALAAFALPGLEIKIHPRLTLPAETTVCEESVCCNMFCNRCINVCIRVHVSTHLTSTLTTHLLSCSVLMATSFCRPSKKAMSLAAMELLVTKLLRIPQMLITTSLEGSFSRPLTGSLVTRRFTTLVAG